MGQIPESQTQSQRPPATRRQETRDYRRCTTQRVTPHISSGNPPRLVPDQCASPRWGQVQLDQRRRRLPPTDAYEPNAEILAAMTDADRGAFCTVSTYLARRSETISLWAPKIVKTRFRVIRAIPGRCAMLAPPPDRVGLLNWPPASHPTSGRILSGSGAI